MKPSSQSLIATYQAMYPADGSGPTTPAAHAYRFDEDRRCQLLLSLMVQMAQSIEELEIQQAKDALALATALKKATTEGVPPPPAAPVAVSEVAEDEEMMPMVQAVAGPMMPTPRPAPNPIMPAAPITTGGEVSLTPFTPYVPPAANGAGA